uniref:Uncharacterized protein LOC100181050 n=1 Tax=Phallusia mammillata TaxID=59560 RepID=A0A6F9DHK5_9ASCI|nr:uncharacterized protein LOC100181050 [Phallusia mammillata]
MQDPDEKKDLDQFLQKVNDLESIMKDLTSDDPKKQAEAIKKADQKVQSFEATTDRIGFDKTVINKKSFENMAKPEMPPGPQLTEPQMDQQAFLNALDADSKRRAKARKERHRQANIIKEDGNTAFKNGEFEKSVEFYTKAMQVARDLTALYTNRAAAYIQLKKYQAAIDDCEFSLRIDEKWIKAFVFKARALQHMCKFDDAVETFQAIIEIDENKKNMVESFVAEVNNAKRIYELESKAEISVKEEKPEAEGILKVINTLLTRLEEELKVGVDLSGSLMYYAGGLRVLQTQLIDEQSRTLFRTSGGFSLLTHEGCISRCLKSGIENLSIPHHASEVVSAAVALCTAACLNLPENLTLLLSLNQMPEMLLNFFEWSDEQLKRDVVTFFHEASLDETSRKILYKTVDCKRLFKQLLKPKTRKADVNSSASATLCNMLLDQKCKSFLSTNFQQELLPIFHAYLKEVGSSDYEALTLRLKCLGLLLQSKAICEQVSSEDSFRKACMEALVRCVERFKSGLTNPCAMEELLNVIVAILRPSFTPQQCSEVIQHLTILVLKCKHKDLLTQCLVVVSAALEKSKDVSFVTGALMKQFFKHVKQDDIRVRIYSLKILCCIAQQDAMKLETWIKLDKGYKVLLGILADDGSETAKINQGHVALMIGYLANVPGGLDQCDPGDVVRRLLVMCRDSDLKACRANCAIALGKLAKAHPRFLDALREHDGINILARNKPPEELLS